MKYVSIIVAAFYFVSCASTNPGRIGKPLENSSKDLVVSVDRVSDYSDPSNVFYNVAIQNKGSEWVDIQSVDVDFPNDEQVPHRILTGEQINAWAQSYAIRARKEDYNAQLGIAGLVLAGTLLMVAAASKGGGGDSLGMMNTGVAAAGAGIGYGAYRDVSQLKQRAETAQMVPSNYILTGVQLPSNGFAEKWFIVHVPQMKIARKMKVTLKTAKGLLMYEVPTVSYQSGRVDNQQRGTASSAQLTTVSTKLL